MTLLTFITLAVVLYGVFGSHGYGRALALGGATAAGAAVAVGSTAVPAFYAVALGTIVALVFQLLGNGRMPSSPRRYFPPGVALLVVFLVWSTFVTVTAPELFDGTVMVLPNGGVLRAGFLTSSNVAQVTYLTLGVCVVLYLARSRHSGPELIGLATGLTTMLSLWRYLHQITGLPFPDGVFDNSPSLAYVETAPNNVQRYRGILSEPAGLAGCSLVTLGYMLPRAVRVQGWRRVGALIVAGSAAYLGTISTSATFVVAGVAIAVIAGVTFGVGFLLRRTSVSAAVSVVACTMVVVALWALPVVANFVQTTVNNKVSSPSYDERSGANSRSYDVFLDTYGYGVGLGANRASSFVPTLLTSTGVVGTALFALAVASLIYRGASVDRYRPVVWALVTLLVAKVIAGPDLSDTTGVLWISLGLLSHAAQRPSFEVDAVSPEVSGPEVVALPRWSDP